MNASRILIPLFSTLLLANISLGQFSVDAGGAYVHQQGSFVAPCGCTYAQGAGFGISGGLAIDLWSSAGLTLGLRGGAVYEQVIAPEVFPADINVRLAGGDKETIRLTYLNLRPSVRYRVSGSSFDLQLAPTFDYLITSSFHHESGGTSDDLPPNFDPDTTMPLRSLRLGVVASVAYEIPFASTTIVPTLSFDEALDDISIDNANGWKYYAITASLVVRL